MQNNNNQQKKEKKSKTNYHLQFQGLLIFSFIFIVVIPIILYKYKYYTILEGYMPNIDLLATSISWHGGPYDMWEKLYPSSPSTKYDFLSQSFINYTALIGLTYIIAREVKETNSIIKGWSMGFIMLLMTYLLPGNLTITPMMNFVDNLLTKYAPSMSRYQSKIIALVGLCVSFLIIYLESRILKSYKHHLHVIGKTLLSIPKLF